MNNGEYAKLLSELSKIQQRLEEQEKRLKSIEDLAAQSTLKKEPFPKKLGSQSMAKDCLEREQ